MFSIIGRLRGRYYNKRGRNAEKLAARKLGAKLCSNPNEPEIDMHMLSGKPVQVKRGSWSTIREHFSKYGKTTDGVVWIPNQSRSIGRIIVERSVIKPTRGGVLSWLLLK